MLLHLPHLPRRTSDLRADLDNARQHIHIQDQQLEDQATRISDLIGRLLQSQLAGLEATQALKREQHLRKSAEAQRQQEENRYMEAATIHNSNVLGYLAQQEYVTELEEEVVALKKHFTDEQQAKLELQGTVEEQRKDAKTLEAECERSHFRVDHLQQHCSYLSDMLKGRDRELSELKLTNAELQKHSARTMREAKADVRVVLRRLKLVSTQGKDYSR